MRLQNIDNKKVECEEPCDGRLSSTVPREERGETPRSYLTINLSTSDLEALRRLQRNLAGSSDYARVRCILMLAKGNPPSFVSDSLGIDVSTVYRYKNAYLHGGESELLENRHKGYWGLLNSQQLSALREELTQHVYTDAKSVSSWIKSAFGIEYTVSGPVDLLNRIGFSYKKTTEVPCEAQSSAQEIFATELSDLFSSIPDNSERRLGISLKISEALRKS